jgi:hypothetical protein
MVQMENQYQCMRAVCATVPDGMWIGYGWSLCVCVCVCVCYDYQLEEGVSVVDLLLGDQYFSLV